MKLQTEVQINSSFRSIDYSSAICLMGSCFSNNIGEKLAHHQFLTNINPHGISFNPMSIIKSLNDVIENKVYKESDLLKRADVYFSYNHHGEFSSIDPDIVLNNINQHIVDSNTFLKSASHLIITFGTAWVYELKESGEIVANCHKIDGNHFQKRLLSVEEIVEAFNQLIEKLRVFNNNLYLIFTISPVRHTKDGVVENSRSKAILLEAVHQIKDKHACDYFPSYEIMMDELRDYRFYKRDLIHPNELAIDYIWNKFGDAYFDEETKRKSVEINKLKQQLFHKHIHPETQAAKAFDERLKLKINRFNEENAQIRNIKF